MLASHPYGALVVASQGLFILLRRRRLREAVVTLAAVGVLGIPFWWADLVLRDRFDVGVGGGGPRLGSPTSVLHYFWWVAGDFSAGHHAWSIPVLAARTGRRGPACGDAAARVVVLVARASSPCPRSRSCSRRSTRRRRRRRAISIFVLPFFSSCSPSRSSRSRALAAAADRRAALVAVAALRRRRGALGAPEDAAALRRRPAARGAGARGGRRPGSRPTYRPTTSCSATSPSTSRRGSSDRSFSGHVLPRADPALLASTLKDIPEPLGRGVWVFDASDTTNVERAPDDPASCSRAHARPSRRASSGRSS